MIAKTFAGTALLSNSFSTVKTIVKRCEREIIIKKNKKNGRKRDIFDFKKISVRI